MYAQWINFSKSSKTAPTQDFSPPPLYQLIKKGHSLDAHGSGSKARKNNPGPKALEGKESVAALLIAVAAVTLVPVGRYQMLQVYLLAEANKYSDRREGTWAEGGQQGGIVSICQTTP